MKKIIYGNIISIILFFILPWVYLENAEIGDRYFSSATFIYFGIAAAICLIAINIRTAIKSKGARRIASIIFIVPPLLFITYFVLGFIAVSRFKIL